jgi:hypothetical protein
VPDSCKSAAAAAAAESSEAPEPSDSVLLPIIASRAFRSCTIVRSENASLAARTAVVASSSAFRSRRSSVSPLTLARCRRAERRFFSKRFSRAASDSVGALGDEARSKDFRCRAERMFDGASSQTSEFIRF